ncbi:MAG: Uma2 family endonuclease [Candidatus Hodarchaeales archaeon]
MVIEILSKSTREIDLQKKLPKYLDSGVKEVWIIDPEEKIVAIHHESGKREWKNPETTDKISSDVIPRIPIQINWIWNRKENPVNKIIKELIR